MRPYKAYLLDLDGTVYRGNEPIPHAAEVIQELHHRGAIIRFLTNNSSQTRQFYADKLRMMGIPCEEREVYSSATGAAAYLKEQSLDSAFVVGMPGLATTLREAGIEPVNLDGELGLTTEGSEAKAVVVGICLNFTYALLAAAMTRIRAGARFVATNPDSTFPLEAGRLAPGAGSLVAAVQTCSGVEPFVVGKPNTYMVEVCLKDAELEPRDALMVGDRLDTDIEAGRRAGCPTHLVLTGVTPSAPQGQTFSPDLLGLL